MEIRFKNPFENEVTKATVELLIGELQEILNDSKTDEMDKLSLIEENLNSWVKANNLHPENIKTIKVKKDGNERV